MCHLKFLNDLHCYIVIMKHIVGLYMTYLFFCSSTMRVFVHLFCDTIFMTIAVKLTKDGQNQIYVAKYIFDCVTEKQGQ